VCASKFAMPPTPHDVKGNYPTFELPSSTFQLIEKPLEDLRLMHMMINLLDVFIC
jgi:hypothetical protein